MENLKQMIENLKENSNLFPDLNIESKLIEKFGSLENYFIWFDKQSFQRGKKHQILDTDIYFYKE